MHTHHRQSSRKGVITAEGISSREKQVYAEAFGQVGAVQCGFCMPGMLISAKSLLDHNPNPTHADVKSAIRYNLCRCTGYVKIEQAIQLAAKAFRNCDNPEQDDSNSRLGARMVRPDATEKLLGTGDFVDDMQIEGMLHGGVLRSRYPRALVKKIDISAARLYPGVEVVLTANDVPGQRLLGHIVHD